MAISIRKGSGSVARALVAAYNALRGQIATTATKFHADITASGTSGAWEDLSQTNYTVTAADASDLVTSITLVNSLKLIFNVHFADAVAHKAADDTNKITSADATDLASVETLVNDVKAKYNAHLSQAGVHYNNDGTNSVATVNATDQATANALANALKAAFNLHLVSAPSGASLSLVDP